nr:hypothetical protein RTCK_04120 [Rhizobium sp. TCK]
MGGIRTQNSSPAFAAAYQEVAIVARDHGIADGRLPTSVASILCPTEMALRPEGEKPTRILRTRSSKTSSLSRTKKRCRSRPSTTSSRNRSRTARTSRRLVWAPWIVSHSNILATSSLWKVCASPSPDDEPAAGGPAASHCAASEISGSSACSFLELRLADGDARDKEAKRRFSRNRRSGIWKRRSATWNRTFLVWNRVSIN